MEMGIRVWGYLNYTGYIEYSEYIGEQCVYVG